MENPFKALPDAFYNPAVYQSAIQRWHGFGGRVLMALAFVVAVIMTVTTLITVNDFEKTSLPPVIAQVPDITIDNGVIRVDAPQPVTIKTGDPNFDVLIDTTKNERELRDTKTAIGVGKNFVFFQANDKYQVIYTDKLGKAVYKINKKTLQDGWETNIRYIKMLFLPLFWLSDCIDLIVQCVVVAVLSYVVTAFMREEYDFLTRMRLAALSLVPATLATTLMSVGLNHHTAPWFTLLLACLYIYVMIVLIRKLPLPLAAAADQI